MSLPRHSANGVSLRLIPALIVPLCCRTAIRSGSAPSACGDHSARTARRPPHCTTTVPLSLAAARTRAGTARIRCQNGRSCSGSRDTASARIAHERLLRRRRPPYHRCGPSPPTCWKNNSPASPALPPAHLSIPALAVLIGRVSFPAPPQQRPLTFPIVFPSSSSLVPLPSSASLRCGGV